MTPALSVLLPVRNGASTIRLAVASTLSAMPTGSELLVFDDGSDDGTAEVLGRVRDRRLRVVTGPGGSGVAAGLNRLLREARGRWVARIDADDVSLPGRFTRQVSAARGGADLVFSGHIRFGRGPGAFRQKRPWHLSPETVRVWLALENPLTHPAMFGDAEVVRAVGGYRPGPAEDYDLWMRLAASGARIERQLRPGIGYRMHPGQVTMGPAYLAALLHDAHLAEAHARLAAELGWDGGSVWSVLFVPATTEEEQGRKAGFWALLRELSRTLPAFEGLALRRALDRASAGSTAPGWSAELPPER